MTKYLLVILQWLLISALKEVADLGKTICNYTDDSDNVSMSSFISKLLVSPAKRFKAVFIEI